MGTNDPFTSNEIHTHLKTNESPNQYAGDRVLQSDGRGFHRDGQNINNVDQESYFHRNRIKRKLNFSPGQRVFLTVCTFMSKQSYHISTENCGKFKLISSWIQELLYMSGPQGLSVGVYIIPYRERLVCLFILMFCSCNQRKKKTWQD